MKKQKHTLDLHGYKSDEVVDAIDRFLVKCQNQGLSSARIMTGKGKGIVKKEAIRYLKLAGFPWSVEKLANGKPNDGVMVVHLD